MNQHQLLYPAFSLGLLTLFILPLMLISRIIALRSRAVRMSYFRVYVADGTQNLPEFMLQVARHFSNLFEVPVLFYFTTVIAYLLFPLDQILLVLFWLYFLTRLIHTIIHLTYNRPNHRIIPFVLSNFFLLAGIIRLLVLL